MIEHPTCSTEDFIYWRSAPSVRSEWVATLLDIRALPENIDKRAKR